MSEIWRRILVWLEIITPHIKQQTEEALLVQQAWLEWHAAQQYYQFVCDPDLVEYAIFAIKAAETKYRYLIKLARMHGLYIYPVTGLSGYGKQMTVSHFSSTMREG